MEIKGIHVAFITTTTFVSGTIGASFLTAAALQTAGLVSIIASIILLGVCIAGSTAGFIAWQEQSENTPQSFFICFQEKLDGIIKAVFQIVVTAIITGAAKGIADGVAGRVVERIKPPAVPALPR